MRKENLSTRLSVEVEKREEEVAGGEGRGEPVVRGMGETWANKTGFYIRDRYRRGFISKRGLIAIKGGGQARGGKATYALLGVK